MERNIFHLSNTPEYIRGVQYRLRVIGKHDDRIPEVFIDGIYGEETKNAVRVLQNINGLPETGELDKETFELINTVYEDILIRETVNGFKPKFDSYEGGVMRVGDEFDGIYFLQALLRELSIKDERFFVEIDGKFNSETEIAVKLLQRILLFEENGLVDIPLWNALIRLTNNTEGYL
jgi:peptidoglycan hydrolase-like protein with peptidoglycan-binding domain